MPEPVLVDAAQYDSVTLEEAARLATASRHPLARALALHAKGAASLDTATEIRGAGVEAIVDGQQARLGSPTFCNLEAEAEQALAHEPCASALAYRCGERQAIFLMRQMLRPDARQAVDALRAQGMTLMIASGDHAEAVRDVAEELGIAEWKACLKPGEKIALLDELKAAGKKVLMIGDGLNDAPALAAAFASLSPISATDLAQASADAVFLGERLMPVASALATTRKAHRLMQQNLVFAALYNAIAVPLAMAGLVTPLIAACAMSGSSILVTANALRAKTAGRLDRAEPKRREACAQKLCRP